MYKWERRLKDLSIILNLCIKNYFNPELFRLNVNQYLQTSRTITFIIQKNKNTIPNYNVWYPEIIKKFKNDEIMIWAKDSRNKIEKIGDLEIHSKIFISLVHSYIEEYDYKLKINREKYIFIALDKIYKRLSTDFKELGEDEWTIKIERQWYANSLSKIELLNALIYIYKEQFKICKIACENCSALISEEISNPNEILLNLQNTGLTSYIDNRGDIYHQNSTRIYKEKLSKKNQEFVNKLEVYEPTQIRNLNDCIAKFTKNAKVIFNKQGGYLPTLFFLNKKYEIIDNLSVEFKHRSDKFIFWRDIQNRIEISGTNILIFISEIWIRDTPPANGSYTPISNLKIRGEGLQVVGIDGNENFIEKYYKIRKNITRKVISDELIDFTPKDKSAIPIYLYNASKALQKNNKNNG